MIPNRSSRLFHLTESGCACEFRETRDEGHAAVVSREELSEDLPLPRGRFCTYELAEKNRVDRHLETILARCRCRVAGQCSCSSGHTTRVSSRTARSRSSTRLPWLRGDGTLPDEHPSGCDRACLELAVSVEVPLLKRT